MAKANRKGSKQVIGSSRKNYFQSRARTMNQGSKGRFRYEQSVARNKNKLGSI
jgi:hypothetical protein